MRRECLFLASLMLCSVTTLFAKSASGEKVEVANEIFTYKKQLVISDNSEVKLPFVLLIPDQMAQNARLIVDFRTVNEETDHVEKGILKTIYDVLGKERPEDLTFKIMKEFKYPVLVPVIPDINGFRASSLNSSVLHSDFGHATTANDNDKTTLMNIDKQVYLMIREAFVRLNIAKRAIVNGFADSAQFATCFCVLHPDIVDFNISGGNDGLVIMPLPEMNGIKLPYPVGINGVNTNVGDFMHVKHFFYIGNQDVNDPMMPAYELSEDVDANGKQIPKYVDGKPVFKMSEDGNFIPTNDNYSPEEVTAVHKLYGNDVQKRFNYIDNMYKRFGIYVVSKVYNGNGANIFNLGNPIAEDIIKFLKDCDTQPVAVGNQAQGKGKNKKSKKKK